jgi:hypothetical protein
MSLDSVADQRALVTLVVRIWPVEPTQQSETFRLEATHVQTGEVAYFRTIEGIANHIERLMQAENTQPIDLSDARRRGNKHA